MSISAVQPRTTVVVALAHEQSQASPMALLLIGVFLLCLGSLLAFNIKGYAAKFVENSSPSWVRRRRRLQGLGPHILVGAFFMIGGVVALVSALVKLA
jgi:hypothetical protein